MISIIICSASKSLLAQVTQNIHQTIGVEYEVIHYDNSQERKGICAIYNQLACKANYPFLCFLHEDILFDTANWGKILIQRFDQSNIDMVGIAGAKYKSLSFSGWYTGQKTLDCVNIVHRNSYGDEKIILYPGDLVKDYEEKIVCLDGVFIATRKKVWQEIQFNEQDLKGFHFYDLDFSFRSSRQFKLAVTYEINIIHLTAAGGDFGNGWVKEAIWFHKKYRHLLPFPKGKEIHEYQIQNTWLHVLKHQKINYKLKWAWISRQKLLKAPGLYLSIIKFLVYRPLGLKKIHNYLRRK